MLSISCSWKPSSLLPMIFNLAGRRHAAPLTPVSCVKEEDWWHGALTAFLEQADWSGFLDTACDAGICYFPGELPCVSCWLVGSAALGAWSLVPDVRPQLSKGVMPLIDILGMLAVLCRPAGELRSYGCSWEWLPQWMLLPSSFLQMSLT